MKRERCEGNWYDFSCGMVQKNFESLSNDTETYAANTNINSHALPRRVFNYRIRAISRKLFYVLITFGCVWYNLIEASYKLRIDNLVQVHINLAEIEAYSGSIKLTPLSTYMSSTFIDYGVNRTVGLSFDGSYSTFCHSSGYPDDYLTATYDNYVDRIEVTNRPDCCQNRIVGARISLTNQDTGETLYTSSFGPQAFSYIFYTIPTNSSFFQYMVASSNSPKCHTSRIVKGI